MSYRLADFMPSRPSTPQSPGYHPQLSHRRPCSHSPPPHGHQHPNYPIIYPQSFTGSQRMCSSPPCSSPLLGCQQPISASPPYDFSISGPINSRTRGLQYGEQRRNSTGTMPSFHSCARILNVELERPRKRSPAATALIEKVSNYPLERPEPIPCGLLLRMFQHLYGNWLDSIERITRKRLRIEDPGAVSCRATICRFDKRDTWRVYKSRPGTHERFYCAPHIEITLPYFPTRQATKEVIDAIAESCDTPARHMQPAYKFKTRTYSWKFEPGMVYESVNAEDLLPKPVMGERDDDGTSQEEDQQDDQPDRRLVVYTHEDEGEEEDEEGEEHEDDEEVKPDVDPGDSPRRLDDIKEELRFGPNKDQCKEIVKVLLAGEFRLDPRRITVWFWVKDVELSNGKWYPWGSLDNTYGLVLATKQAVLYNPEDAKRSARRASRAGYTSDEKGPRDVALTVRVILPAERTDFAKDDENVKGLKKCVEQIRTQLSMVSADHSRAAFCISWKKERREFADWIAPHAVYKPTGVGDNYVIECMEGCKR